MTDELQPHTHCRTCNAPIVWALTEAGRRMPVDAAPDPAGNVALLRTDSTVNAVVLGKHREPDPRATLHQSHWATCPNPPARSGKTRRG